MSVAVEHVGKGSGDLVVEGLGGEEEDFEWNVFFFVCAVFKSWCSKKRLLSGMTPSLRM